MFDLVVIVAAVLAFVRGVRRGLIGELAGLVALAVGVYGAARFSPVTEEIMSPYLAGYPTRLIAFAVTLAIIVVAVHVISALATRLAKAMALSVPNRILGGLFCAAKVLLVFSCVIGLANRFAPRGSLLSDEEKDELVTYRFVEAMAEYAFPYIDQGIEAVRNAAGDDGLRQ